jgi:hypothetical protein
MPVKAMQLNSPAVPSRERLDPMLDLKRLAAPLRRGLSRTDAATYVGIGTTLFDQLVERGVLPRGRKFHGRLIFDLRQLDRTLDDLFDSTLDPFAAFGQDV